MISTRQMFFVLLVYSIFNCTLSFAVVQPNDIKVSFMTTSHYQNMHMNISHGVKKNNDIEPRIKQETAKVMNMWFKNKKNIDYSFTVFCNDGNQEITFTTNTSSLDNKSRLKKIVWNFVNSPSMLNENTTTHSVSKKFNKRKQKTFGNDNEYPAITATYVIKKHK